MRGLHIGIVSARRPARVRPMLAHLGSLADQVVWYVDEEEGPDYRYAGAGAVVEAGGLVAARNLLLEHAFRHDNICVQLSDDLTGVDWSADRRGKSRITLELAISLIVRQLRDDVRLAGAGATDNEFFLPKDDVSDWAFILGDLMAAAPNDLRFDSALTLREDQEYSIQHLKTYGRVARCNRILANWQHYSNHGGVVSYRTTELEQETIAYLKRKHPGWIKDNPRRENEILLADKRSVAA